MSKRKTVVAALLVLALALAFAAGVAACGSSDEPSPTSGTSSAVSAADKAAEILGHQPAGLAKIVVDRGYLVVANDPNYAPQSSINKDTGELEGFDVDVAKLVGEALGLEIKFENPKWDSVIPGLVAGAQTGSKWNVSIGSMTITPERQKMIDFTDPYYFTNGQLVVKVGSPKLTTIDQLKGKKIGVGTQTTYQYFLDAIGGVDVSSYDTDLDAFPVLENGGLDAVMTAELTASEAISSGKPFELSGKPVYYEPLGFGIAKDNADLLALLNYSIKWMRDNGKLTEASKTWYHGFDVTKAPATGVPSYDEVMAQLKG
jgi:polar amino acid transport system substrate-binding protein